MKKLLTIVLLCWCVGCAYSARAVDPVKQYGQLQVKGAQLCDQQGQPVILHGLNLEWDTHWPRMYNKKYMKTLKREGQYPLLRLAMEVSEDNGYLAHPQQAMACLKPVIETAIKQNIYVIIDWHANSMHTQEARQFFGEIAQRYGRYPHIIYEIYNEPIEETWTGIKKYASEVISEIRRYDPDNIVLVGCPHWNQDIHLVTNSPLDGFQNVMYTVHFYAATHGDDLRQRTEDAVRQGIPIFISECGAMEASGEGPIDLESEAQWVAMCHRLGISFVKKFLTIHDL
jgi:endoglucanase